MPVDKVHIAPVVSVAGSASGLPREIGLAGAYIQLIRQIPASSQVGVAPDADDGIPDAIGRRDVDRPAQAFGLKPEIEVQGQIQVADTGEGTASAAQVQSKGVKLLTRKKRRIVGLLHILDFIFGLGRGRFMRPL